jgi:beta-galactosidase
VPFGQEQMHAGLLRPDSTEAEAADEVRQAAREIAALPAAAPLRSRVALVFDYASDWVTGIMPQGRGFSALRIAFEYYSALRHLGLDIDIISSRAELAGYTLVVIPCQPIVEDAFVRRLEASGAVVVVGAGSGSKTADFAIPPGLAPEPLRKVLPLRVTRIETLRGEPCEWIETVETALTGRADGHYANGCFHYLARYPAKEARSRVLSEAAKAAGLQTITLPEGLRVRRTANLVFVFNYAAQPQALPPQLVGALLIGNTVLAPAGIAVGTAP